MKRVWDYELVRSILTHPEVYPGIHDDSGADREDYEPPPCHEVVYLSDGEGLLFLALQMNAALWQGHMAALPGYRGKVVIDGLKDALGYMKQEGAHKVIGLIPAHMKHSIRVSVAAGMRREGVITKAFLRDGVLHDLVVTGVELCHPQQP